MTSLSAVIAILAISVCVLLAIVVYNKTTRWIAAIIVPMLCVAAYLGWNSAESVKGFATKKIYDEDALYLGSFVSAPNNIYVWVQPLNLNEPVLMVVPFTQSLAAQMAQANKDMCEGKPQGTRGAKPGEDNQSRNDEDEQEKGMKSLEVYDFNIKVRPMK